MVKALGADDVVFHDGERSFPIAITETDAKTRVAEHRGEKALEHGAR